MAVLQWKLKTLQLFSRLNICNTAVSVFNPKVGLYIKKQQFHTLKTSLAN